jgi:hypothetical protein
MRPWASWTAKTVTLAVGFAAAAGGLSGVALAGTGGSASSGDGSAPSINRLIAPASLPMVAVVGGAAGSVVEHAVAPVASALGATGPLTGPQPLSAVTGGDPSALGATGPGGMPAQGASSAFGNTPGAGGAGDTNVPAASQLIGLGAMPGLADLPSLTGLATMPTLHGLSAGGIPIPGTALSAVHISGMSTVSFAALAVGALLAGASALKIAGRRARDRKAGIGATI